MGFDTSSITPQVLRTITMGQRTAELAAADTICRKITDKDKLQGSLDSMDLDSGLARDEDRDLTPGARCEPHGGGFDNTTYHAKAQVGSAQIFDEGRNDSAAEGLDIITDRVRFARAVANAKVDMKLFDVLSNTGGTFNVTFNAASGNDGNGAWDDYTNGTPLRDLLKARLNFAPGADSLIYTPSIFQALQSHPELLAEVSNYSDGQLDFDALNGLLARKLGISASNIFYVEKLYNTAKRGQTPTFGYVGNGTVWMGYRSDLIMVDPQAAPINDISELERDVPTRSHYIQHTRYIDIIRPTLQMGVTFTNVLT